MDFKILSAKAKELGIWINIFNKKLFKTIANNMSDDEKILYMLKGHDIKTSYKYPAVITDKKIYIAKYATLYGGLKSAVFTITDISNIFNANGIFFNTIVISENNNVEMIKRISKKRANEIMDIVNSIKNKSNNTENSNSDN